MRSNTRLERRRAVVSAALENLEGRRLFAAAYTVQAADADYSLGEFPHYRPVAISNNGLVLFESNDDYSSLIYDINTGKTRKTFSNTDAEYNLSDINSAGTVVGTLSEFKGSFTTYATIVKDGKITKFAGKDTDASAINEKGDIVGSNADFHVSVYSGGKFTDLGTLNNNNGGVGASGYDINESGQVVGDSAVDDTGAPHAFISVNGKLKDLGLMKGDDYSQARFINDNGLAVVIGGSYDGTKRLYVSDNGAAVQNIPLPSGGNDLRVTGIDNNGTVIAYDTPDFGNGYRPFIYRGGKLSSANDLIDDPDDRYTISDIDGINDQGQIIGEGYIDGEFHTLLLTPIGAPPAGKTGTVTGTLFEDTDGDGNFDANETFTGSRTVFLDTNGNGLLDAGETSVKSNAGGKYTFTDVPIGTVKISRVFPAGYHLSNPSAGTGGRDVLATVKEGKSAVANIGTVTNAPTGTIGGVLFNDDDGDNIFDKNETVTGIRTVFLDTDGDGKLDAGETSVQSDKKGKYAFLGLAYGTYKVTRVYPAGYRLPGSPPPYQTVKLDSASITLNIGTQPSPLPA